jgi:hypothetical protein
MSIFHGLSAAVPLGLPKGMPGLQWVSEQGVDCKSMGTVRKDARARFAEQNSQSKYTGPPLFVGGLSPVNFSQDVLFVRHVSNELGVVRRVCEGILDL